MTNLCTNYIVEPAGVHPLIRIVTTGFWKPEVADGYLAAFDHSTQLMRRQYGYVRALVDSRMAAIHPKETIERLRPIRELFSGSNDRIAIVVATILKKQQVVRSLSSEKGKVFVSIEAAEDWLASEGILVALK